MRTFSLSLFRVAVLALALAWGARPVEAQVIGTYAWQLQPYCNLVRLTVAASGGTYLVDGYDDQCGAPTRASVTGTAIPNPNGTIEVGLTIVVSPAGRPVHVSATVNPATLSGTWSDNTGASGAFVFTAGAATGGSPRPLPSAAIGPMGPQGPAGPQGPQGPPGVPGSSTGPGAVPVAAYDYYMNTTLSQNYDFGQMYLHTTGTAGTFQFCRPIASGSAAMPYVRYVNGARATGSLSAGSCVAVTVGSGGDFQIYMRRTAVFGVHAGDGGGADQNYTLLGLSQFTPAPN